MEYIETSISLVSKLQIDCICSIGTLKLYSTSYRKNDFFEIQKMLNPAPVAHSSISQWGTFSFRAHFGFASVSSNTRPFAQNPV